MRIASLAAVALLVQCSVGDPDQARRGPGRVPIALGAEPFTEYVTEGVPVPVLFPIRGPGGIAMTRSFPLAELAGDSRDHPHHRSLWFAHGAVNGDDFWTGANGERIEHEAFLPLAAGEEGRVLRTRNSWRDGRGRTLCTDERRIAFGGSGDARFIDFRVTLRASEGGVVFGDTKEGTMAIRVAESLRLDGPAAKGHIVDSEGRTDGAVWGKRARWIDYTGPVDGTVVGVTVMDHPRNLRHPTWWHARGYGLAAANPFGAHDFEGAPQGTGDYRLGAGRELVLRYRFWFHRGNPSDAQVAAAYDTFAAEEQ